MMSPSTGYFLLTLIFGYYSSPGLAVVPQPFETEEACRASGITWKNAMEKDIAGANSTYAGPRFTCSWVWPEKSKP